MEVNKSVVNHGAYVEVDLLFAGDMQSIAATVARAGPAFYS
jgi:hypothetical protein